MSVSRGGKKSSKSGKKETTDRTSTKQWCFTGCKNNHKETTSMVQCHICQIWAHLQCIEEKDDDIIGIWCCQKCRKLPEHMSALCDKIDTLQKDMSYLLNFAKLFDIKTSEPVVHLNLDLSDSTLDSTDRALSLTQSTDNERKNSLTIIDDPPAVPSKGNTDQHAVQNQNNINDEMTHEPEHDDTQGQQSTETDVTGEGASLTGLEPASSRPIMPVHDVYIGGAKPTTTNDDLRTYLLKIGVTSDSIMSIDCISGDDPQSSAFRVKICDKSIIDTVYKASNFKSGIIVKPYRIHLKHQDRYSIQSEHSNRHSLRVMKHTDTQQYTSETQSHNTRSRHHHNSSQDRSKSRANNNRSRDISRSRRLYSSSRDSRGLHAAHRPSRDIYNRSRDTIRPHSPYSNSRETRNSRNTERSFHDSHRSR